MISEEKLNLEHLEIKAVIEKYILGKLKVTDVKKVTSGFGIYSTKDKKFMTRVRKVGGEFTTENLKKLADIMGKHSIKFAHVSTRDCIQLQGVNPEAVYDVVRECTKNGMPFKGGGGNSYRNPLISPLSGISKESIFDVRPYAIQTDLFVQGMKKAFNLGRKFKVSFSAEPDDHANTIVNDLGFLATVKDGEKGFIVYSGGGLGRGPAMGSTLLDFLPARECIKATVAMIELFHDHGNREQRTKARLRFLAEKLGFKEFKELFLEYYSKVEIPNEYLNFEPDNYNEIIDKLSQKETFNNNSKEFETWSNVSVKETRFKDISSVRLFIGKGNFTANQLYKLVDVMENIGCSIIRLTPEQDIYIPFIHKSYLENAYNIIIKNLEVQGAADIKFENHLVTCLGASLCGIGLLDTPVIGEEISKKLDELFIKYSDNKDVYNEIIDGIKFSGCGSSCAGNQIAPLGFEGTKKLIDKKLTECFKVYIGGRIDSKGKRLSKEEENLITVMEAPEFVVGIVEEFLLELKKCSSLTFADYMQEYRK